MTGYQRLLELYQTGSVPWDAELPPPEVLDFVSKRRPGRALDLGCGYGRAAIYLAQQQWQVDAVDFIPEAVRKAAARAEQAGVARRIQFHTASVARLDFLDGPYQFALDVGCLHNLSETDLPAYRDGLIRLLAPGATYLLFVRLQEPEGESDAAPRGLPEPVVRTLFASGFELQTVTYGQTQVEDAPGWRSAWFWYQRSG